MKIKSVRETLFWPILELFSRTKNRFHAHFFANFHGRYKFFTGTFKDFFTYGFFFSRGGCRYFLNIFTYGFRFSRVQNEEFPLRCCPHNRIYFGSGCGGEVPLKIKRTTIRKLKLDFSSYIIFLSNKSVPFFGH